MQYKEFKAEFDLDAGTVKGYASTWDREPDSYGDIVAKGAFAECLEKLEESGKVIPLLFGHNSEDPNYNIGKVTKMVEDDRGLYVEGAYDDSEMAQRVRELAKDGRIDSFSFAYEVLDAAEVKLEDGTKARELRKMDIFEVSLVTFPANRHAVVTDAKSESQCIGKAHIEVIPHIKAGRVLSKSNEDDLKQALSLIQGVLAKLDAGEDAGDEEKTADNAEVGDAADNAEVKAAIDDALTKIDAILSER